MRLTTSQLGSRRAASRPPATKAGRRDEAGLEASASGHEVGRDPRTMKKDEFIAAGHAPMSPLKAIRARCLDCCAEQPSEVRLCIAVGCPNWPFRMGVNLWRTKSEARQQHARTLAAKRAAQAENRQSVCGAPSNAASDAQ